MRKNKIQQRIEFQIRQKNDLYQRLFHSQKSINVDLALELTLDNKRKRYLEHYMEQNDKLKQNLFESDNVENIRDQISTYLKDSFYLDYYNLSVKKKLKHFLKSQQVQEMNFSWFVFEYSGARTLKNQNKDVYQQLLDMGKTYPEDYLQSINLDVVRTVSCSNKEKKLLLEENIRNVLTAYAVRNPFVGYCQGQNFIVDFLLNKLDFDQEDAFWIYTALIENIMPIDYYTSVVSAMVDYRIMEHYLDIYLQDLKQHFKKIDLECNFFALNWFICIYTNTLHPNIIKEVFVNLLVIGIRALIITGIVILYIFKEDLLKIKEFTEAIQFLNVKLLSFDDRKKFNYYFNQIKIKKKPFIFAREQMRKDALQLQNAKLVERQVQEIRLLPKCNSNSNICNKVIETNRVLRRCFSFFIFQNIESPQIIPDYLDNINNIQQEEQKKSVTLLVGKQYHICNDDDIEEESKTLYRSQQVFKNYDEEEISISLSNSAKIFNVFSIKDKRSTSFNLI